MMLKNQSLYLLLLIIIVIFGGSFYVFELRQEKERVEKEAREVIEAAREIEKIKQERIFALQKDLDSSSIELRDLKEELDILRQEKERVEKEAQEGVKVAEEKITELQVGLSSLTITLEDLEKEIAVLQKEKAELGVRVKDVGILDAKIKRLQEDIVLLEAIIRQHPDRLEKALRDPTWAELKDFLRIDRTNEIIFDLKKFDCSGFAITLFRNARAAGFRTAYVEVVFDLKGHALNKFRTTDRGYVFIDVTGDRHGTGRDTVAYIRKGELFSTIYIGAVVETKIDCGRIVTCRDFINPLPIKRHTELFAYPFFQEKVVCGELYNRCLVELNTEIDRFNRRVSDLSSEQLMRWRDNNTKLLNQLTVDRHWVFIETENRVTNVEIYW